MGNEVIARAKARMELIRKQKADRDAQKSFFGLSDGENRIRILPPAHGNDWIREAAYHYNVVEGTALLCPQETYGTECPICETVEALFKTKVKENKDLAKSLRAKTRCFANVLDVTKNDGKVLVFAFGVMIRDELLSYFADDEWGDISDPEKGNNVKITKTGEQLETSYDVKCAKNSSPVPNWPEVQKGMHNLEEFVKKDLLPYEKLKAMLEGTDDGSAPAKAAEEPSAPAGGDADDDFGGPSATKEVKATSTPTAAATPTATAKTEAPAPAAKAADEFAGPKNVGAGGGGVAAERKASLSKTLERLKGKK